MQDNIVAFACALRSVSQHFGGTMHVSHVDKYVSPIAWDKFHIDNLCKHYVLASSF
jgi:hypothetical protein